MDDETLSNFKVTVRVTDRMRKPAHLEGEQTEERVNWTDEVEAKKFVDEDQARLAILLHYKETYSPKQYKVEILDVTKTLVVPQAKLIIPE